MKRETLVLLRCPYCGAPFNVTKEVLAVGDDVSDAVIECGCREALILKGILILKTDDLNVFNESCAALKESRGDEALFILLGKKSFLGRAAGFAFRKKLFFASFLRAAHGYFLRRRWQRVLQAASFRDALSVLGLKDFGSFLEYRFSSTSFLASLPLLMLIGETQGNILELGCGMGHHSYLISRLFPDRKLYLADKVLLHVLMAKIFFTPEAECVCADFDYPLPFSRAAFGAVFSSDALHYVNSKQLIFQEIRRVLSKEGVLLLAHLHNRAQDNFTPGVPLTFEGWKQVIDFPFVKILPEESVLGAFLDESRLDLAGRFASLSLSEIEQANAFLCIASNDDRLRRDFTRLYERFQSVRTRLIINPLYAVAESGDSLVLHKRWNSKLIQSENVFMDTRMPQEIMLKKDFLKSAESEIDGLRRQFVLIDVPEKY